MISIPIRPKSIYIPHDDNGCFTTEFDSTYPTDLNGIISPDEFQESMNRINHPILSKKKKFKVTCMIFLFLVMCGICFIIAAKTTSNPDSTLQDRLLCIGILLLHLGIWPFCIACCTIKLQRDRKMVKAVAKESIKYYYRSPTPCTWRLGNSPSMSDSAMNDLSHLVIDIGPSMIAEGAVHHSGQLAPVSISLFQYQDNYSPPPYSHDGAPVSTLLSKQQDNCSPPPYSDQFPRFCSQCNAPRSNLSAKFCSLCGHSFDKY